MMSAPPAIDFDVYSSAVDSVLCFDPSEKESGVAFNVAMMYVLPADSPADVNVQHEAVKGADSFNSEPGFKRGYRGNGTTFRIGAPPGVWVSIKSPSSCLIGRVNVGMIYPGIMLFGIETSGVRFQRERMGSD